MTTADNNGATAPRQRGRPFKPGQSGNPGGRPRGLALTVRKATKNGTELITFLVQVATGRIQASVRDRLVATGMLLDRAFGKPTIEVMADTHITERTNYGVLVVPATASAEDWCNKAAAAYSPPAIDDEQHAPRLVAATQRGNAQ